MDRIDGDGLTTSLSGLNISQTREYRRSSLLNTSPLMAATVTAASPPSLRAVLSVLGSPYQSGSPIRKGANGDTSLRVECLE